MEDENFEPSSSEIKSETELLREKNIRERDAYMASFMNDPEFAQAVTVINSYNKPKLKKKRKASRNDVTFRFTCPVPLETRRSSRLQNKPPLFTKDDLIDESVFNRKRSYGDDDYHDLENIVFKPKKPRMVGKRSERLTIISVEEVTDYMIKNIARQVSVKVYSEGGSSCHQCRQKTNDQKTCCRSENCVGMRGQFCGVCLNNRYGEDAAQALKDPNWHCPVCRGICNCSFCRAKAGKRPTGILTPLAHRAGHNSVKDFLDSLKGEGDYEREDSTWQKFKDPNHLLGFSQDLRVMHMGGGVQHVLDYFINSHALIDICRKKESELISLINKHKNKNKQQELVSDLIVQ